MSSFEIRRRWALLAVFAVCAGLSGAAQADFGPGSRHNNPGPGNCRHQHAGLNTSSCTGLRGGDGASCKIANQAGVCRTRQQQCYCVRNTPPARKPQPAR